jgi:lipopolysaccharide transport system permease protein
MVQILMFITPVIYPISLIKNELVKNILSLNPIATAIQLARTGIVGGNVHWPSVLGGIFASLFFLIVGLFVFRSVENEFADIA